MRHIKKVRFATAAMLLVLVTVVSLLPVGALTVGNQDPAMSIISTVE